MTWRTSGPYAPQVYFTIIERLQKITWNRLRRWSRLVSEGNTHRIPSKVMLKDISMGSNYGRQKDSLPAIQK